MAATSPAWVDRLTGARSRALELLLEQLARVIDSVGSVAEALSILQGQITNREVSDAVDSLQRAVASGLPLSQALRLLPRLLREDQLRLIEAGESAGALVDALNKVATGLRHRREQQREWLGSLAYPALLLHGALAVLPVTMMIQDGFSAYFLRVGLHYAALWTIVGALVFLIRGPLSKTERLIRLPLAGPVVRLDRAAALCWSLGALYEAGVTLHKAVGTALPEDVAEQPAVRERLRTFAEGTSSLKELLASTELLPMETLGVLHIAEESGNLGEALQDEAKRLDEATTRRLRLTSKLVSRAIYYGVVALVVWSIASFYIGYFGALGAL